MGVLPKVGGKPQPYTVSGDTLGLLDLSGGKASALVDDDRAALGPLFRHVRVEDGEVPRCEVLFVYGDFSKKGRVRGYRLDLGEIVAEAGAPIVVVATPHSGSRYIAMRKNPSYTPANMVMTLDRKGEDFAAFFGRLFELMKQGTPMTEAWVQLAPQVSGGSHDCAPESIFEAGVGEVVFADSGS